MRPYLFLDRGWNGADGHSSPEPHHVCHYGVLSVCGIPSILFLMKDWDGERRGQRKNVYLQVHVLNVSFCFEPNSYALSTLPERRQEVQTYIFFAAPLTFTFTDLMLDFHILLDLL